MRRPDAASTGRSDSCLSKTVADRLDGVGDLPGVDRQRRLDAKDVPRLRGRLHDDAALEERQRQPLAGETLAARAQLDGDEQSAAANVGDERMPAQAVANRGEHRRAAIAAARDQPLVLDDAQRLQGGDGREGVSGERRAVQIEAAHRTVRRLLHAARRHRHAN